MHNNIRNWLISGVIAFTALAPLSHANAVDDVTVEALPDDSLSDGERVDAEWTDDDWADEEWQEQSWSEDGANIQFNGFIEGAVGTRLQDDVNVAQDLTLAEVRIRLETSYQISDYALSFKGDGLYDDVLNAWVMDIRDLSLATSLGDNTDIKFGRQIMTWGTGDLLFLNDLFAKDWQAFFSGREDEYLKAASNSLKVSYYPSWLTGVNLDLVYTPEFTPDNYLNGERFSFNGSSHLPTGFEVDEPNDDEWSARVYGTLSQLEWALYGYLGYSKSPEAINKASMQPAFYRMNAWGASLSQPIAGGLANAEVSYYDSKDDAKGTDPFIPNSQWRGLVGYEHELVSQVTLSGQYYVEHFSDDQQSLASKAQTRQVLTARLTYRGRQEKLTLSLFSFYSPTDEDGYLRPVVSYRVNDQWSTTLGANLFMGKQATTFFGQFEDATNVYWRLRYNY